VSDKKEREISPVRRRREKASDSPFMMPDPEPNSLDVLQDEAMTNRAVASAQPAVSSIKSPEDALRVLPGLASAVQSGRASFDQLAAIHYDGLDTSDATEEVRIASKILYSTVRAALERAHGRIVKEYWCSGLWAGAIRTERELWVFVNDEPADAPIMEIVDETGALQVRVEGLPKGDRDRGLDVVYASDTNLLYAMDQRRSNPEAPIDDSVIRRLRANLKRDEDWWRRAATRSAQLIYFMGMLYGFGVLLGTTALAAWVGGMTGPSLPMLALGSSFVAGGVGALVSVLSRMTFGGFTIDHEADGGMLRLLGGIRPMVGALFGAAFHVLVAGGLLPIAIPDDPVRIPLFFVGLAFLAGFSERWAQDMLAQKPATTT
jgi:hypothetical protein